MKVVIDTSIIIDYIRGSYGVFEDLAFLSKKKTIRLYIPTVIILELWKGKSMESEAVVSKVERMLRVCKVSPLSEQIAKHAGELIRKGIIIDFIDACLAATTLYLDAQLATRNRKHFEKVRNLNLFSPQKQ